jgi:transposase
VFIDETSVKTNRTRLYGRCAKGERLIGKVPHNHWVNVTYICGIKQSGIVAPMSFVGGTTNERFLTYVREVLCPVLRKEDVVVMDNLNPHKQSAVREWIHPCQAEVFYLPPYRPDLNPIELSFSKLKALLRKEQIREVAVLQDFLLHSSKHFTQRDCKGFFKHAGYSTELLQTH